MDEIFGFHARGLGKDKAPGCFICGGDWGLYDNFSGFVQSKEDGEKIVAMFKSGAWLDYRDFEPNWIQVKVGACKAHEPNLLWLQMVTQASKNRIMQRMVDDARRFQIIDSATREVELKAGG